MTTSEDESTTYHRNLLYIFRHVRDTFPKSWGKAVDVVGIPENGQGDGEGAEGGEAAGTDFPSVRSSRLPSKLSGSRGITESVLG